jgi:hypothetical protein
MPSPARPARCYNVVVTYVVLILGTVLAFFGYAYSRAVGFGITVLCAAATAYFLMPPAQSIRVSEMEDLLALSAYCIVSGVVLPFSRSRRPTSIWEDRPTGASVSGARADLGAAVAAFSSSSELSGRVRATHIDVEKQLTIRCLPREALHILSDISRVALDDGEVRELSLDVCQLPGRDLLFVTAHRAWPPPLLEAVTIGKREEDCEPIHFPTWPQSWRATRFDNGYADIYQVSIPATRVEMDAADSLR